MASVRRLLKITGPFLQKSPIKETIFYIRDIILRSLLIVATPYSSTPSSGFRQAATPLSHSRLRVIPTVTFHKTYYSSTPVTAIDYGVVMTSSLLKFTGLFCKRALLKRLYSAKETYNFKEPTNRSHPILLLVALNDSCKSLLLDSAKEPYNRDYILHLFNRALLQKRPIIFLLVALNDSCKSLLLVALDFV